jgi:hypothetical protein
VIVNEMKKLITPFCLFLTLFLCFCAKRPLAPEIGDNISFPGAIVALNSSNFLVLNTSANGDYSNGSIQSYSVNNSGIHSLQTVMPVLAHGSELAVSDDGKLVALSFDSSRSPTEIWFYDYSNLSAPSRFSNLKLVLPSSVAKQSVKNLGIFRRSIDSSDTNYYVYGTIYSFKQEDNKTGANIPERVFVAKVDSTFTSAELQFILSYGLNDPKSLVRNSVSNSNPNSSAIEYMFGFSSPTYDAVHDLFIAFPTGAMDMQKPNNLVDALPYFAGSAGANQKTCSGASSCLQTDFRTVSLAAVDMKDIVDSKSLNLSTYFVPLGWNQNGMPYASKSNGVDILNSSDRSNADVSSFSFQAGFWSSYWANTLNNGSGATGSAAGCYSSTSATSAANQYSILGDNSLFVVKRGSNGSNDKSGTESSSGYGNEVFGVTGLEILNANISSIKSARTVSLDASDFKNIVNFQLIDSYNTTPGIKTPWVNGASGTKNAGPLTFFMYSRTSQVKAPQSNNDIFKGLNTGIKNFGVLKFPGNVCLPYWARLTYSTSSLGRDSSWLTSNPTALSGNQTYLNLTIDPTKPSLFSFQAANGEEACTDVSPVSGTPRIFCINFIYGKISRFTVQQTDPVFTLN